MMKNIIYSITCCAASIGVAIAYSMYLHYKSIKTPNRNGIISLMTNTPLIYLKSLSKITGCNIYAKCEYYLPYTHKDRVIKNITLNAEKKGLITKDTILYEGSTGNAAYSLASIAKLLGFKCTVIIPTNTSNHIKLLLNTTTQCTIIETKQCSYSNFTDNYIRLSKKKATLDPNGFYINQFFNEENYMTHYNETGPEIWRDMNGTINAFVCSAGTGGTLAGISKYLKERDRSIKVCLADIEQSSGLYAYVKEGVMWTKEDSEGLKNTNKSHSSIEGIGSNILTDNFKEAIIDDAYKVSDEEAIQMQKDIYREEGIDIGGSSAVNLCGVVKACQSLPKGSNVVTVLFDSGNKDNDKESI